MPRGLRAHRVHVSPELFAEGGRLLVVDHVLVDAVLDDDEAQQVVVDDGGLHLVVIKVHLDQSNIANMYVVNDEPDLSLEEAVCSMTF